VNFKEINIWANQQIFTDFTNAPACKIGTRSNGIEFTRESRATRGTKIARENCNVHLAKSRNKQRSMRARQTCPAYREINVEKYHRPSIDQVA